MTLLKYRKQRGVTRADLAKRVGVHPHSLSQIAHGRRRPSWKLAGRIELATDGAVPRSLWFEGADLVGPDRATDTDLRASQSDTGNDRDQVDDTVTAERRA
jgi:transcriptional regulator with XRE-family HTH domain